MKNSAFLALILMAVLAANSRAEAAIQSVFTDVAADCVIVSASTEQAPIDFYESQCKSFGGYILKVQGSDLRYSPVLSYNDVTLDLQRPMSFHDMSSTKIEWIYSLEASAEGMGSLEWKGMIYHLTVSEEAEAEEVVYAVRLQKEKSCVLGVVTDDASARKLILADSSICK